MSLNSINPREDNNKQELLSIMNRILLDLDTMTDDWDSFFSNREKRPYQIQHVQAVIQGFIEQIE
jgi:hypothetical protein